MSLLSKNNTRKHFYMKEKSSLFHFIAQGHERHLLGLVTYGSHETKQFLIRNLILAFHLFHLFYRSSIM